MQAIGEILPAVFESIAQDKKDFIKRKATEYANIHMRGGNLAAAYKRDYDSGLFTDNQATAVVKLADVYISFKEELYTRSQDIEKQKEIFTKFLS